MADKVGVYSSSSLVHTGSGQLMGIVLSSSTGSPLATVYDNTTNSGTKVFEAYVANTESLVIFFSERFAPKFVTGLYIALAANITAVLWTREL